MKKFVAKFLREFEVELQAEFGDLAAQQASSVVAQFPAGTCKLLSIIEDGVAVEVVHELKSRREAKKPRQPKPDPPGGSPATPVIKVPVLADQVAEVA